jgi:MazG family protein
MQENSALERAMAMVRDLRARCAWDRVQTRATLRPYLVEEVHELDHAIAEDDPAAIRREVADLLLHLAWQLVLAEELGEFTPDDAAGDLERKMKRRHPHLYGLGDAEPWEVLKARERGEETETREAGVLDGLVPAADPLRHAHRIPERVARVGFDWPDANGALEKTREEVEEVRVELASGDAHALEGEIGDLLFSVVNLARLAGVDAPTALARANAKFVRRFASLEQLARARGMVLEDAGLEALDRLWDEAKRGEG